MSGHPSSPLSVCRSEGKPEAAPTLTAKVTAHPCFHFLCQRPQNIWSFQRHVFVWMWTDGDTFVSFVQVHQKITSMNLPRHDSAFLNEASLSRRKDKDELTDKHREQGQPHFSTAWGSQLMSYIKGERWGPRPARAGARTGLCAEPGGGQFVFGGRFSRDGPAAPVCGHPCK